MKKFLKKYSFIFLTIMLFILPVLISYSIILPQFFKNYSQSKLEALHEEILDVEEEILEEDNLLEEDEELLEEELIEDKNNEINQVIDLKAQSTPYSITVTEGSNLTFKWILMYKI